MLWAQSTPKDIRAESQEEEEKQEETSLWFPPSPTLIALLGTVALFLKIQNTQEIKGTLFHQTKQDKTGKFSRKSSFSSYVRQYNRKQLNQLILCQFDAGGLTGRKGHLFGIFFSER